MILILHIALALSSLVFTTAMYFRPSRSKIHVSYALVASTLGSGLYLVISTHSPLVSSCLSGIVYLAIATAGIVASRHKLELSFQKTIK